MAYGFHLEAEYESGYVLTEDAVDHSPYDAGRNVCHAITNGRPTEAGHGRLVRFSLIPDGGGTRYDIDWRPLWEVENPRPIYYRTMRRDMVVGQDDEVQSDSGPICECHYFGFQHLDEHGDNVQKIEEVIA